MSVQGGGTVPKKVSFMGGIKMAVTVPFSAGAQLGRRWGRAPAPEFHTLTKQSIISYPSYYKYTCTPLSKLPSCAPAFHASVELFKYHYNAADLITSH